MQTILHISTLTCKNVLLFAKMEFLGLYLNANECNIIVCVSLRGKFLLRY